MSDIDRYEQMLLALTDDNRTYYRNVPRREGNIRLPANPKRALEDIQSVQRDILASRELSS